MLMDLCWFLSAAAIAAAAVRVMSLGLARRYQFSTFYWAAMATSAVVLRTAGSPQSRAYMAAWVAADPILQVGLLLAVAEAYGLLSGQFPRLGAVGGWLLGVSTALGLGLALAFANSDIAAVRGYVQPAVMIVFLTHRWISTIALVMLGGSLLFLSRFKRPIAPNVDRHVKIWLAYLTVHSAAVLALFVWGKNVWETVNIAELLASAACGLAWVVAFSRRGEFVERSGSVESLDQAWRAHHALIQELRPRD